jgi:hypothetical protein
LAKAWVSTAFCSNLNAKVQQIKRYICAILSVFSYSEDFSLANNCPIFEIVLASPNYEDCSHFFKNFLFEKYFALFLFITSANTAL